MTSMDVKITPAGHYDPTKPRLAEPDEIDDVMKLCKRLDLENGRFPTNWAKVYERMQEAVNRRSGIVGVIGQHRKLEAIIYLVMSSFWNTDEVHIEEIFAYVPPEHRRSTHAKQLIEFAKETADSVKMRLFMGVLSTIRTQAKIRLYRRMLGEPVGAYFIYGKGGYLQGTNTEH
jgi:GNAT superfamily N-acetyltransferase